MQTTNGPEFTNDSLWTGNLFVAVGDSGSIKSSPDAVKWDTIPSGTDEDLLKIGERDSGVVILASDGNLFSLSGPLALPEGFLARDFLFDNEGKIIASGDQGLMAVERDDHWTVVDTGAGVSLGSIAWTGFGYIAIGGAGTVVVSESNQVDGPWAVRSRFPGPIGIARTLEKLDSGFEVFGSEGGMLSSDDGRVWERSQFSSLSGVTAKLRLGDEQLIFTDQGRIVRLNAGGQLIDEYNRENSGLNAAASAGTRLVAVGEDGIILLSRSGDEVSGGFEHWMAGQGATVSGFRFNDDWDGDGVANIMEYLHGFSSSRSNSANTPSRLPQLISTEDGIAIQLELQTENQGFIIQVQESTDMAEWRVVAEKKGRGFWSGEASVAELGGVPGRPKFRFFPAPDDGKARYYRPKVLRR